MRNGNRWITKSMRCSSYSTINSSEVKKFASVGSDWWDSSSSSGTGPLHGMNPARISFITNSISQSNSLTLKGLRLCDIGCGGGIATESFSRLGAIVTGIDPALESINIAKSHSKKDILTNNITYLNQTIEETAARGIKFDVISALEVVEHVENLDLFFKSCSECLDANGHFFVSTINRTIKSYAVAIAGAEYILHIVPPGTHDWNKFITPQELSHSLNKHGFKVHNVMGIIPNPFGCINKAVPMAWTLHESDTDINYIVHATKE